MENAFCLCKYATQHGCRMRVPCAKMREEQIQRLNINRSLLYVKSPTLTDSPFQPAYLDFVLGLSVYHWRRAWFDRASGNNRVGDREGKKEEENDRGKERERKRGTSMTSKEITCSLELLFSCYHFPRQHSCHRSVWINGVLNDTGACEEKQWGPRQKL